MKKLLQKGVNLIPYKLRKWVRYVPVFKQIQQWLVSQYMASSSFEHRITGGPASGLVYPVDLPQDKQIWLGNYEQEFSEALARAVTEGMVCYDIGGYRGFFSGVLAMQNAGEVHVFEPLPENIAQIREMTTLNKDLPITVHNLALSDTKGEAIFNVMPEASMGKLGVSDFENGDSPKNQIKVKLDTLDSMLAEGCMAPAQLVKIDVEGAELMVLNGGEKFIAEHRPVMYIEAHSPELTEKCVDFLMPYRYKVIVMETGKEPDHKTEPAVCHLVAKPI